MPFGSWATAAPSLDQAGTRLDAGTQFLTLALDLMANPHAMYETGSEAVRVILNRTIFTKLWVDGDTITGHELREPFSLLHDTYSLWQGYTKDAADTAPSHPQPRQRQPWRVPRATHGPYRCHAHTAQQRRTRSRARRC